MTNLEDVLTQTISQQCVVTQTRQRLGPIITTILWTQTENIEGQLCLLIYNHKNKMDNFF